jgi:type IV pilus assembly protein PilY1
VIDNIGPVTAAITKLQDKRNGRLWLYFGTGRYFYKLSTNVFDDPGSVSDTTTIRKLYGIQEPCYSSSTNDIDQTCSTSVSESALDDQTDAPSVSIETGKIGWYIKLDAPASGYLQERVITDPLAVFSGVVFFTTFSPSGDICAVGGNTYVWAVDYKSGAQPSALMGKALVQVSTGEIKEISLASAFSGRDNRRSAAVVGVPPKGQGLSVLIGPRPLQKILHIQEK